MIRLTRLYAFGMVVMQSHEHNGSDRHTRWLVAAVARCQ